MLNLIPRKDFYAQLAKIPIAAGALFSNKNKILLVKPSYKEGWSIPGGMVEADESPFDGLRRETREEIGLQVQIGNLLCVDYRPKVATDYDDASLHFIFDCGELTDEQVGHIKLSEEHTEFGFFDFDEAIKLCDEKLGRRISQCIQMKNNNLATYLEDGVPLKSN